MAVARRKESQPGQVDRAIVAVERAVCRLVAPLGDDDPAVMEGAALTLAEIGPFAVGPLEAALPKASSSRHGVIIIGALVTLGRQARVPVMDALIGALKREPDPHVKAAARVALEALLAADMGRVASAGPSLEAATRPGPGWSHPREFGRIASHR